MKSWFRFYDEVLDDLKVQSLPAPIFKAWVNLLCFASRNGGVIPSISDVAFALRVPPSKASKIIGTLCDLGLFDDAGEELKPHNWSSRQYKSDVSTERVKRFRKRNETVGPDVSETASPSSPPHTPPLDPPTEQSRADKRPPNPLKGAFASIWGAFPGNLDGKRAALRHFNATVKNLDDFQSIQGAMTNYERHLEENPDKPPKNGSTWFNNWRDWIEWQPWMAGKNGKREPVAPQIGQPAEHDPNHWCKYCDTPHEHQCQLGCTSAREVACPEFAKRFV